MAVMSGSDLPPAYYVAVEEDPVEKEAAEVRRPDFEDLPKDEKFANLFKDKASRIALAQKVLAIKLFQAIAVAVIMSVFVDPPFDLLMMMTWQRPAMIVMSTIALVGTLVLMHGCNEGRFKRPFNYFFLLMYPLSVAFFISVVTFKTILGQIFTCWLLFIVVLFVLLLYSILMLPTYEFKTSIAIYIVAGCLVFIYGLMIITFLPHVFPNYSPVFYGCVAVFALTGYMLYEIRAMTLRDYHFLLAPSDCVKAALLMHVDYRYIIMNWFRKNDGEQDAGRV